MVRPGRGWNKGFFQTMGEGSPTEPVRRAARRSARAALLLTAACCALPAVAQTPAAPTRAEVERPPPPSVEQPRARLTVEGGVERAPCALDRPEYQNIRFTLNDVAFDELRGLTPEQLRAAWAPFQGQEVGVATICEIRDRAAT